MVGAVVDFTGSVGQTVGSPHALTDSLEESTVTLMDVRSDLAGAGPLLIMRVK